MIELGLVFLTGVITGRLSCLAVQSGLLASSLDSFEITKENDQLIINTGT